MLKRKFFIGIGLVLLLSLITVVMAGTPDITSPTTNPKAVSNTVGDSNTFSITVNQTMNISWYINGTPAQTTNTSVTSASYTNTSAALGTWNVSAIAENENGTVMQVWDWTVNAATSAPTISNSHPSSSFTSYAGTPVEFNVTSDQIVNVSWTINNVTAQTDNISVPT